MLFLYSHHITDLYCLVDDIVHEDSHPLKIGRPPHGQVEDLER